MANPVTGAPEVFATEAAQTLVENGNGGAPVHVESVIPKTLQTL